MAGNETGLSKEAQEWDNLIRDVHEAERGVDDADSGPYELSDDVDDGFAARLHEFHFRATLMRLMETRGGKIVFAAIVLLFILLALAFIPNWGSDEENTTDGGGGAVPAVDQGGSGQPAAGAGGAVDEAVSGGEPSAQTPQDQAGGETEALPPSHAELAAQDPIPLTEGTWRFFADASEESALYDFAFEPTGRFYEDDAEHNEGAYEVAGSTVEMTLVRVATVTASDGTSERSADVAWNEWFTMTRVGNTMTGTWTGEQWRFGYDDGFVLGDIADRNAPGAVVFARPQRPDDPG